MSDAADTADKPHYAGHRARLRERFLAAPDRLPDYELLELLLFLAIPQRDVKPLAKVLIGRFGSFARVITAEPSQLMEIKGVRETTVVALKSVREAAQRLLRAEVTSQPVLGSWNSLVDYCRVAMAYEAVEQFRILFLNRKNMLIADEVQGRGTVDHTPVYPREIVKRALELGATALIMVHNHPSGDPEPSRTDVEMTREIRDAAGKLGIVLHDHLVVGHTRIASFKEMQLL